MSTHYFRFTRHGAADRQRSQLLERLLARADESTAVTDWRADAFRLIAPKMMSMPGVGAAGLCAEIGAVDAASVFLATPVHYVAEMSSVRLPADGILSLTRTEADALAADFNRVWNDAGFRLLAGQSARLYGLVDQTLEATTQDPEELLDQRIENQLPAGVPPVDGWTAGDDPFFSAFAAPRESTGAASGVMVTAAEPGSAAWRDVESSWLERSLADLTSGRIARLELSAGRRRFSVGARWSWRRWRRHRPWWEHFA